MPTTTKQKRLRRERDRARARVRHGTKPAADPGVEEAAAPQKPVYKVTRMVTECRDYYTFVHADNAREAEQLARDNYTTLRWITAIGSEQDWEDDPPDIVEAGPVDKADPDYEAFMPGARASLSVMIGKMSPDLKRARVVALVQ